MNLDPNQITQQLAALKPEDATSYDDLTAGKLFASVFHDHVLWNTTARDWMCYTGKVWKLDSGGMIAAQCAKALADALLIHATTVSDERKRIAFTKWAGRFGSYGARKTMVDDARSEHFACATDFDADGDLLNLQNGVLDLRTFELRPHSPNLLLSKLANAAYIPDARSERFERFILEIMQDDASKALYLQKTLGLALTTDTSLETCWIWYGPSTRNGKGTLAETIAYVLGGADGYACTMDPQTLAQRKKDTRTASGDIARLAGCRFLNCSEPPKGMLFDAALLKSMLGRDTITARHIMEREFEFVPTFKLFMNSNYLPHINDETLFTSGRINIVLFERHFEPQEQDGGLKDELRSSDNLSGILNWMIEGLRMYRETGLTPPWTVSVATAEYQEQSDKIRSFIDECLLPTEKNSSGSSVYKRYATWCAENGYGAEGKQTFFSDMRRKGLLADTATVDGRTVRNAVCGYELINSTPF